MPQEFHITASDSGQRLDIFCVSRLAQHSRSAIQKAIKSGQIVVNGQAVKPGYVLKANDSVRANISQSEKLPLDKGGWGDLPLPVLYEDKNIKVINKPADVDSEHIPGRAHRLDKDTTGVLVTAKTPEALEHVQKQFKQRRVKKEYLALVFGRPGGQDGRINQPLARSSRNPLRRTIHPGGKPAITEWKIEKEVGDKLTLLRVFPLTGRTHQIRAHLHWLGFPVVGDKLYTFKRQKPPLGVTRQLLHAENLTLTLPSGKRKTFTAPLPADFQSVLK